MHYLLGSLKVNSAEEFDRGRSQYRSMENLLAIERTAVNAKYSFRSGYTKPNEVDLIHGKGR
jgi:hypothetical protein